MTHLKALSAPKTWKVKRKEKKFIVSHLPGPHNKKQAMPIALLLRDILGVADSLKEVKRLINGKEVLVDKRKIKNYRFPVGFMDVVEFPKIKKYYRITLSEKGKLCPIEISQKESDKKIVMISNKTKLKKGFTQLNLNDGRNIKLKDKEAKKYKTEASLLIKLPEQEILEYMPFVKGMKVMVLAGKHIGELATIKEIIEFKGTQANKVTLVGENNKEYSTLENYAFVVGNEKPVIKIR